MRNDLHYLLGAIFPYSIYKTCFNWSIIQSCLSACTYGIGDLSHRATDCVSNSVSNGLTCIDRDKSAVKAKKSDFGLFESFRTCNRFGRHDQNCSRPWTDNADNHGGMANQQQQPILSAHIEHYSNWRLNARLAVWLGHAKPVRPI